MRIIQIAVLLLLSIGVALTTQASDFYPAHVYAPSVGDRPTAYELASQWDLIQFKHKKITYIKQNYRAGTQTDEYCAREYKKVAELLKNIRQKKPATVVFDEVQERAFYSKIDGSFQPMSVYVPSLKKNEPQKPRGLIVYLHHYGPRLDIVNWNSIPEGLLELADTTGMIILAPFARGNTDFQGIGEADVFEALEHIKKRYSIDSKKIHLTGISMGGMGAWTIAGRNPHIFAGVCIISARADYYYWHKKERDEIPLWRQRLIDVQFGAELSAQYKQTPLLVVHGDADRVVPYREGLRAVQRISAQNPQLIFISIKGGSHWIYDEAYRKKEVIAFFTLSQKDTRSDTSIVKIEKIGAANEIFTQPFICVNAYGIKDDPRFVKRVEQYQKYTQSKLRQKREKDITAHDKKNYNLLLFGEPESSALIRAVIEASPLKIDTDSIQLAKVKIPRASKGLWLCYKAPWNKKRVAVVNMGLFWGEGTGSNHVYDMLPAYSIYTTARDYDGANKAVVAGFFDKDGNL